MNYGRLTILSTSRGKFGKTVALCQCACGAQKSAFLADIKRGRTNSCGCIRSETTRAKSKTHGMGRCGNRPAEYTVFHGMKSRCMNPNHNDYKNYGGRGVTVCPRWLNGESGVTGFECFLADMGRRPTAQHCIERVDNERGYAPDNCVWATRSVQSRNRRNNRLVSIKGQTLIFADALAQFGKVGAITVCRRINKGWSDEEAFMKPARASVTRVL